MIQENFIKLYEHSFRENWDLPCYTDYGENESYTYGEVAQEIAKLHLAVQALQPAPGRQNSDYRQEQCPLVHRLYGYHHLRQLSLFPFLQDFNPNDVHHIVNHSESVFLFTSDSIWEHLEEERLTGLRAVFSLTDFRCLHQRDGETIQRFLKHLDEEMHRNLSERFPPGRCAVYRLFPTIR